MTKQYRSREGEATAVDTKTQLTTLGSETAPGPLLVPAGMTKLAAAIVAASANYAAATGSSGLVRLEGPGLPAGPEVLAATAEGSNVATGGAHTSRAVIIPLDVPVTTSQEILIFGEMVGTDVGQMSFGVTLVFSS